MNPAEPPRLEPGATTDSRRLATRLATPPLVVEHTHWSLGLIGFYLSCAGVALGATFAASGYLFFGSKGWLWFGSVLSAVSCVACFLTLSAARRPATRPPSAPPK